MRYLHLGGDTVVSDESVVAVFDLDNVSYSHRTREFLRLAQQRGHVVSVAEDLPRSVVLCEEDGQERVYLSLLSTSTLLRRAEAGPGESENILYGGT